MNEQRDTSHVPSSGRIAVLSRNDRGDRNKAATANKKVLHSVYEALAALGVAAEPVVYSDDTADEVRDHLLEVDGVLVWVDPIVDGRDRSRLDAMLREVASKGVWISAHPDVILKMGTKEVLYRTRRLRWGTDTRLYASVQEFHEHFPRVLSSHGPRVLKQNRGNGGIGVFRVELIPGEGRTASAETRVRVQHAHRGSAREELQLGEFMRRCEAYLESGQIVDQPFQPRHAEGMVRCYLVQDRVAGFGHQLVTALMDPPPGEAAPPAPPPRVYYGSSKPEFQALKLQLESEWVPELQRLLDIDTGSLPALWDADFLLGPKTESGEDTYVLCEINVSCVFPFPHDALTELARSALTHIRAANRPQTATSSHVQPRD